MKPSRRLRRRWPRDQRGHRRWRISTGKLFNLSSEKLRQEIQRITGRKVREAAVEIEPLTGDVVAAFITGTVVQIFLLSPLEGKEKSDPFADGSTARPRAEFRRMLNE